MRRALGILLLGLVLFYVQAAAAEAPTDEFRLTLSPYHRINDEFTSFERLGYSYNEDTRASAYSGSFPGLEYSPNQWLQLWAALSWRYTDNRDSADQLELRPYIGPKLFLPNELRWNIYNYTRYEFRNIYDFDTHKWEAIHRL